MRTLIVQTVNISTVIAHKVSEHVKDLMEHVLLSRRLVNTCQSSNCTYSYNNTPCSAYNLSHGINLRVEDLILGLHVGCSYCMQSVSSYKPIKEEHIEEINPQLPLVQSSETEPILTVKKQAYTRRKKNTLAVIDCTYFLRSCRLFQATDR